MPRWAHDIWGYPVNLDLIHTIIPCLAPQGHELRAYTGGDENSGYYVLFRHPRREICDEWLAEFLKRTGGLLPKIFLPRTCPTCTGVGVVGDGATCADCEGTGAILVDPAEIPAEEADE